MRKNTLRVLSSVMCLILLATLVFQAPLMAATQTIPVRVGGETFNVTPGQWVSVRSGTQITHYNVRFVNGRPVALEMSQYTKLVFGEAGVVGSTGSTGAQTSSGSSSSSSSSQSSSTSKPSTGSQSSQNAGTPVGGSVADDVAQSTSQTTGKPTSSGSNASTGTAGSVADDVAQATQGTSGSSQSSQSSQSGGKYEQLELPFDKPTTGQSNSGTSAAGSVADDLVQAGGSSTTTTQSSSSSTTKTTWDPSRHPRDPQTGRFISHEEAVKRGLMDPPAGSTGGSVADDIAQAGSTADDVAQAGNAGSTADDVAQAGNAGSTADDVAQAGAAGSVADDAAQSGGKPGVGDKFRAGYETGKGMTQQGFQNVKDSLKSGFSAKNLLVTAGITVGVDLATQIMRGEKPSVKKALKTVCSAEFVGGVGGAVVGAAAGSFFVPFLTAIPVVGGALSALAPAFGSIVGSSMGAYLAGDLKNGKFSIKEAFKRIDWVGVTGQAIGSTVGAALGSALGPIGTIAGGMIGGYLGNWAAQKIAGMFGRGQANLPELAMPTGGGSSVGGFSGPVTIGGNATVGNDAAPVSGEDVVVIGGNAGAVVGDYESEVALAYSKYQELYKLYNEMIRQSRQADALAVADAMNKAKREYDELRAQAGK